MRKKLVVAVLLVVSLVSLLLMASPIVGGENSDVSGYGYGYGMMSDGK